MKLFISTWYRCIKACCKLITRGWSCVSMSGEMEWPCALSALYSNTAVLKVGAKISSCPFIKCTFLIKFHCIKNKVALTLTAFLYMFSIKWKEKGINRNHWWHNGAGCHSNIMRFPACEFSRSTVIRGSKCQSKQWKYLSLYIELKEINLIRCGQILVSTQCQVIVEGTAPTNALH